MHAKRRLLKSCDYFEKKEVGCKRLFRSNAEKRPDASKRLKL